MIRIVFGIFILLHGMVHLLYFGQSGRYFELQPGMTWPDGSWVLARLVGSDAARRTTSIALILAAAAFAASAAGIFLGQGWWRTLLVGAAVFSSLIYLVLWDGSLQRLDNQGAVGILINLALLAALLVFHWPDFDF